MNNQKKCYTFLGSLSSSLNPYSESSKSVPLRNVSPESGKNRTTGDIQNHKLDVILFNFFGDVFEVFAAHAAPSIGDQDDFPLIFQLLAMGDDHLDSQDDRGDRCMMTGVSWV